MSFYSTKLWVAVAVLGVFASGALAAEPDNFPVMGDVLRLAQVQQEPSGPDLGLTGDGPSDAETNVEPTETDPESASPAHWRFGAGLGIVNQPVEKDFEGETPTFDLFFDYRSSPWWNARLGLNQSQASLDGSHLSTTAVYATYAAIWDFSESWSVNGGIGAAWVMAKLLPQEAGKAVENSGLGTVLDLGLEYAGTRAVYGVRLLIVQHESSFDGLTISTGSNQLQLTLSLPLN